MSTQLGLADIEYPESDGKPMGETDVHRGWMIRIIELLQFRYRRQRVYVTGNLLVYYEVGRPERYVVPDALVVKECDPGPRRVYKIWEEGRPPHVVFEVTSRGTKREDTVWKTRLYASLGVGEFFLYDPTGEYLKPPLRGYRLVHDGFDPIQSAADGWMACEQLGIRLRVEDGSLVMRDSETGEELQTSGEAAETKARNAATKARKAATKARKLEAENETERAARQAAEANARDLQAQLERLQAQLKSVPDRPNG